MSEDQGRIELVERLTERYRPTDPPSCRVCGRRLSIQRIGGGMPTVWACSGRDADGRYLEGRSLVDDHYARSEWTDLRHGGDADVMALLREVVGLERQAKRADELAKALRDLAAEVLQWVDCEFVIPGDEFVEKMRAFAGGGLPSIAPGTFVWRCSEGHVTADSDVHPDTNGVLRCGRCREALRGAPYPWHRSAAEPCKDYRPASRGQPLAGACMSDGHYLCKGCAEYDQGEEADEDAERERGDGDEGVV